MEAGEFGGSCEKDSQVLTNSEGEVCGADVASSLILVGSGVTLEDLTSLQTFVGGAAEVELREAVRGEPRDLENLRIGRGGSGNAAFLAVVSWQIPLEASSLKAVSRILV